VVHGGGPAFSFACARGDIVTLIPAAGEARGVVTEGLRYALRGEHLAPGSTRGVSNVAAAEQASVSLHEGSLLVVRAEEGAL